jgi:hypothetical protein
MIECKPLAQEKMSHLRLKRFTQKELIICEKYI